MSFGGYLKADTQTNVTIGPVVAVGDGYTPVTNLAVSTADEAEIIKHAATSVTDISGNTFTAITNADGYYYLTITAAQLDTEGRLTVLINDDSLCLPVCADFEVVNANVYDSLFDAATTDYLQVDTLQIEGSDATTSINTEALDVINTDTFSLPGQTDPPGTPTLVQAITYLYKFLRNKIDNDGSTIQVYDDAGTTVDQKASTSESGGTVTRNEFQSGP